MDHYTTDRAIIQLLRLTWPRPVDTSFYKEYATLGTTSLAADSFFSEPYPRAAIEELGYPICKHWDEATIENRGRIYKEEVDV